MTQFALSEAVPLAHAVVDRVARDSQVRVMFIKGPAAQKQGLRTQRSSVDVDAFVDPAGIEVLTTRLGELGWTDQQYSTPTAPSYSRTRRHASWPCELDLHTSFPGLYGHQQHVFERLWARHEHVSVAGLAIPCLDPQAHSLILALNCLRDPQDIIKVPISLISSDVSASGSILKLSVH